MNSSLPLMFETYRSDLANFLAEHNVVLGTSAALGAILLWYSLSAKDENIKNIRGWPIIGHWEFFTKRHDFLMEGFKRLPSEPMFGFNIFQHNVVALRGEATRKMFYERKDLSFVEGYRLLFGFGPELKDVVAGVKDKNDQEQSSWVIKHLTPLLRMERLGQLMPQLMSDLERNIIKWGDQGQADLFEDMGSIVFQLTIRTAGCREISDSVEQCQKMESLFWLIEEGTTPTATLFPWFPSEARRKKVAATTELYNWFDNIIKARHAEGRRENDAMQQLLDIGHSTIQVIEFILFTLFGGIVNTGPMISWLFVFLDQEPEWRARVVEELQQLLDKYASGSEDYSSVAERFSRIPTKAWENETPVLEVCLRETIRLVLSIAMVRRVVNGDVTVAGKTIPNGTFLAYSAGELHHDPEIYPNPSKFDPGRFAKGQDKSQAHAFLGWGVGRHICLGRRFAQFETKVICAMFLATYEYGVVNSKGERPHPSTTVTDKNNLHRPLPKDGVFYINYKQRRQQL